jgi:hypothetical protein
VASLSFWVRPDSDLYLSEWHIKESLRVRLHEGGFRDRRGPTGAGWKASLKSPEL